MDKKQQASSRARTQKYARTARVYHQGTRGQIGAAAEFTVCADLNWRGFEVTRPTNPISPDDMHARIGTTWYTVQVKATGINVKTGALLGQSKLGKIASNIVAWVLPNRTIRYEGNGITLPMQLRDENVRLYEMHCDTCEKITFRRMPLYERTHKEQFCDDCGEQLPLGLIVEEDCGSKAKTQKP